MTMRDFTQELLDEGLRRQLRQDMGSGNLGPQDMVAVLHGICRFGLIELLPEVGSALNHDDSNVRISALDALAYGFDTDQWETRIKQILTSDPDEDARTASAIALGSAARRSTGIAIPMLLKSVFMNENEAPVVREASCRSFLYGTHRSIVGGNDISYEEAASLSLRLPRDPQVREEP